MTRRIGIVACSAEGAALCYRTIAIEGAHVMGEHDHPEVAMHSIPLARYMECIRRDDWRGVAGLMLTSARQVATAGADFAICPDNTIHQALDLVLPDSPIPWLHIAEVVAEEAHGARVRARGDPRDEVPDGGSGLPVAASPAAESPGASPRRPIGKSSTRPSSASSSTASSPTTSRAMFDRVMASLAADGCDAAALACTEIPLIVRPEEAPLPTLDSTRLLAQAAVRHALEP